MIIAYLSHPGCLRHDMGPHPECPARLEVIGDRLLTEGLDASLQRVEAPRVDRELLEATHDPAYVQHIHQSAPDQGRVWLDGDTAMNPHSLEAALRAAGAVQLAVDLVLEGAVSRAFCAVRPPGHHALSSQAMGFCLFNNVVVGARRALQRHGLERVAILDFDVHHGNGTEELVSGDNRILFCSTFQHPFYPHSGHEPAAANVINTPLAAGSGSREFRAAVTRDWLPALLDFAPELLLVSAGFDAHREDDIAGLELEEDDYAWVTRCLCEQATRSAAGRVVSTLEGGYALPALGRSVAAHLRTLAECA